MAMRCARRSSRQNGENGATNGDLNVRIGREAAVVTWQLAAAFRGEPPLRWPTATGHGHAGDGVRAGRGAGGVRQHLHSTADK
jgi:hypothetical protein